MTTTVAAMSDEPQGLKAIIEDKGGRIDGPTEWAKPVSTEAVPVDIEAWKQLIDDVKAGKVWFDRRTLRLLRLIDE